MTEPAAPRPEPDPLRQAGFQRIWTLWSAPNGSIRARSDDIRTEDLGRLLAFLDELRV